MHAKLVLNSERNYKITKFPLQEILETAKSLSKKKKKPYTRYQDALPHLLLDSRWAILDSLSYIRAVGTAQEKREFGFGPYLETKHHFKTRAS